MIAAATEALDDPVWAALTSGNRALAEGGPLAKRYPPDVSAFAATANRSPEALQALVDLVPPNGRLALVTGDKPAALPGLSIGMQAPVLQMILETAIDSTPPALDPIVLGRADIPEMLDLTGRTRPGPFGQRTIELGQYIGLRVDGTLAAMAGERMHCGRFVEISAVCVDPAYRGKGYAALLMTHLARTQQARGETPFLHVFTTNTGAIALYEKLGFTLRRELYVTGMGAAAA